MSMIFRTRNQLSRVSINFISRLLLNSRSVRIHDTSTHSAFEESPKENLNQTVSCSENGEVEKRGYIEPKQGVTNESRSKNVATQKYKCVDNIVQKDIRENNVDFIDDSLCESPGPLDICTEDISDFGPEITHTFTFAKFANRNRTIQELINLGVELYKLEKKRGVVKMILERDFEKDIKPYIRFLHDCGVTADALGHFFTKCPYILNHDMDDLYTRIRYLRAHNFDSDMVKTIVTKNPSWLIHPVKYIDERLGYFQHTFRLTAKQVRNFTVSFPKVITCKDVRTITFSVKEEMGFEQNEQKSILLKQGNIWLLSRPRLISTWIYVHEVMKLPHSIISKDPHILTHRKIKIEQRHKFLKALKRVQFDPTKPLYVSPTALVLGSDEEFCKNVAKASIETYDWFLKTF